MKFRPTHRASPASASASNAARTVNNDSESGRPVPEPQRAPGRVGSPASGLAGSAPNARSRPPVREEPRQAAGSQRAGVKITHGRTQRVSDYDAVDPSVVVSARSLMRGDIPLHLSDSALFGDHLPEISKAQIPVGSVLVWGPHPLDQNIETEKARKRHGIISRGQEVAHQARPADYQGADATAGHVAMWLKDGDEPNQPEVGEASRAAVTAQSLRPGCWVVFAPQDPALAREAANIMKRWTQDQTLEYQTPRSVSSVPLAVMYGRHGSPTELEGLLEVALQDSQTPNPSFGRHGTFCSEIVANAFLSASAVTKKPPVSTSVPERTTPSGMHSDMVSGDAFNAIGIIRVPPPPDEGEATAPDVSSPSPLAADPGTEPDRPEITPPRAEQEPDRRGALTTAPDVSSPSPLAADPGTEPDRPEITPPRAEQEPDRRGALSALRAGVTRLRQALPSRPKGEDAYAAGRGVYNTYKISNWASRQTSAEPKRMSTVRQDGEAPPSVPKVLAAAAAQAALSPTLPEARVQADLHQMLGSMDEAATWQGLVQNHLNGTPRNKDELLTQLGNIKTQLGLRDAEVVVLAKSLLTKFSDAEPALEALAGLRETNILRQVLSPDPNPSDASLRGWELAAHLQTVPGIGLRLLGQLSHHEGGNEGGTFEAKDRPFVKAYFEAARVVAQKNGHRERLDPHTLYTEGAIRTAIGAARERGGDHAWPGRDGAMTPQGVTLTLAEKALLALRDAADPDITTTNGCAFALHMLHGGMRTDERLDSEGKPSEYHKAESRACKTFGRHLDRAIGTERKGPVRNFMARFLPHKNKSPFIAHDRLVATDKVGFGLAHDNGVHHGRAVKDMVGVVMAAHQEIRGYRETTGLRRRDIAQPTQNHLARIRHQCRLAILELADSETVLLPRFANGEPMSEAQLMKAKAQVLPRLTTRYEMADPQRAALAEQVEAILRQENLGLTPQTLLAWGHAAGGPSNITQLRERAHAQRTEGAPDWAAFEAAYLYSTEAAQPRVDTPPLSGATRQDAGAQLAGMIRGEELGSGFSLENGGFVHGRTGEVSGIVTRIFMGGLSSARVDVGGGDRRRVTFESGVDPARSFIKVGVSQYRQVQAGLGGSVGFKVGEVNGGRAAIGAGADAQYAYELVHQEGTIFAFPRNLSGDETDDRELADKKAQLLELLVAVAGRPQDRTDALPKPANPEDQGSLIKAAYQAFGGQISVGRYEMNTTNHKTTLAAGTETRIQAGPLSVNLPEFEFTRSKDTERTEYNESSGSLRVKRVAVRHASQVKGVVSVGGAYDLSLAKRGADFSRAGTVQTTHRLMLDGEELPTSYGTVDYLKPGDFAQALESGLDTFARDKSAEQFKDRHATDPASSTQAEKQTMINFAAKVMNEKDLTATPQLYYEFGSVVEAANLLEADAAVSRPLDRDRAQVAQREAGALHEDAANREGRFLFSTNARSLATARGVNGLGGLSRSRVDEFTENSARYT